MPWQFWKLTPREFDLMMKGHAHQEELKLERTAWAVALIMNSTGNFKKPVTVNDLIDRKGKECRPKADPYGWKRLIEKFGEGEVTQNEHSG